MKSLNSISKVNPHTVPEGYFERLPLVLQKRIETVKPAEKELPYVRYVLRFALPLMLILVITLVVLRPKPETSVEQLLKSVSTEQLVAFLEDTNLYAEEFLYDWEVSDSELETIEEMVYQPFLHDTDELKLLLEETNNELNF